MQIFSTFVLQKINLNYLSIKYNASTMIKHIKIFDINNIVLFYFLFLLTFYLYNLCISYTCQCFTIPKLVFEYMEIL